MITDSPITGRGVAFLGGMKDLDALHLINTRIGDDGLETIGRLSNLKNLAFIHLYGNRVTEAGAKELRQKLPNLQLDLR